MNEWGNADLFFASGTPGFKSESNVVIAKVYAIF